MNDLKQEIPVINMQIGKKFLFENKKTNVETPVVSNTVNINNNSISNSGFNSSFDSDFIRASNAIFDYDQNKTDNESVNNMNKNNNFTNTTFTTEITNNHDNIIPTNNNNMDTGFNSPYYNQSAPEMDEIPITAYDDIDQIQLSNGSNTNTRKNNIINLSWFLNSKINDNITDNNIINADLCTVSYNIDFGNIRVDLFKRKKDSFYNNVAFLDKFERLCYGTIYPGSLMRFIYSKEEEFSYTCMEQLVSFTGEMWQFNRPVVRISKTKLKNSENSEYNVEIKIDYYEDTKLKSIVKFDFITWQIDGLKHCFEFAINNGLLATSNNLLLNNKHY